MSDFFEEVFSKEEKRVRHTDESYNFGRYTTESKFRKNDIKTDQNPEQYKKFGGNRVEGFEYIMIEFLRLEDMDDWPFNTSAG